MAFESDVTIIGGGWSGLLAAKHMRDNGLSAVVLEARDKVGGVWRYSDDPSVTTVMRSTRTTSSRCITEVSDFPMPDDYPHFPHHTQVIDYLDRYVERFDLGARVHCNTEVVGASKVDGRWEVIGLHPLSKAQASPCFPDDKSTWPGRDRRAFIMLLPW